jgi:hypothetical protein
MKLSNKELLNKIWVIQIKKMTAGALLTHFDGKKSVARCTADYIEMASSMGAKEREVLLAEIDDDIDKKYLQKRIAGLVKSKDIKWISGASRNKRFSINASGIIRKVFSEARNAWMELGIPVGYSGGIIRSAAVENYESELKRIELLMLDKFAGLIDLAESPPPKEKMQNAMLAN